MQMKSAAGRVACGAAAVMALAGAAAGDETRVFLQWFEASWNDIERKMPDFFIAGYDATWLPPPSKAASTASVGYDTFNRFDLGKPGGETAYGTEEDFRAMVDEFHRANALVYVDAVLNHNSGRTESQFFQAEGGWPGFWMNPENPPRDKMPTDDWGDFHNGNALGYLQSENPGAPNYDLVLGDLVALVDIAPETNHQFIRQPVTPGDPDNIPAGTRYNKPDPDNARFYPDRQLLPSTFTNPGTARNPGSQQFTVYPFNTTTPLAGDPVTDNTTGLLMRWSQWMMDEHRVDGMRLDASKHLPTWFWDTFFDVSMHKRRKTPSGGIVTAFTFGENVTDNGTIYSQYVRKDSFARRDALDLNGAGRLREMVGGGGLGGWGPVLGGSGHLDISDDGFQNGSLGVKHVFSHDNGSVGDGGSLPAIPSDQQMGLYAHAYLLMSPGPAIVYHNARGINRAFGFFPREGTPIALGWNPSTVMPDDRITELVQLRRKYRRGFFFPLNGTDPFNTSIDDVLVFEMAGFGGSGTQGNVLVAANDRYDAGTDTRNVVTSFPPGTRLHEQTGNAADPLVDPAGTIPEVLVVDGSQRVLITVPRNRSTAGLHNGGYVVYGPALPSGSVTLIGASGELPADTGFTPDSRQRVNPRPIITGDSFQIELITTQTDALDPNTDSGAAFKINQGFFDWNGNGSIDFSAFDGDLAGYERFVEVSQPLFANPGAGQGVYRETIDATLLEEGVNYLSTIAFRNRPAGEAPLFNEWRHAIYVDRLPPQVELVDAGQILTALQNTFTIRALDRTVTAVHFLWDLPQGDDPVAAANFLNQVPQHDRFEYRWVQGTPGHGFHRATIVAFEETGNVSVTDYQVFVDRCGADLTGSSDPNDPSYGIKDGDADGDDFFFYLDAFASANLAVCDLTGSSDPNDPSYDTPDGDCDGDDFFRYLDLFAAGCS
ncbi:MAG: GC-type dockerin domain-anchored protein [Phycisphaerales bacterium JB037]